MKNFLKEFETFAVRGNAIDLAVAVVIGAAFNQITTSLVNNIITPPIGLLIGGFDFSKLAVHLGGDATIQYGLFLQAMLNFVFIAFALFLLVRVLNSLATRRKREEPQPARTPELNVLLEIRDTLRENASNASHEA